MRTWLKYLNEVAMRNLAIYTAMEIWMLQEQEEMGRKITFFPEAKPQSPAITRNGVLIPVLSEVNEGDHGVKYYAPDANLVGQAAIEEQCERQGYTVVMMGFEPGSPGRNYIRWRRRV